MSAIEVAIGVLALWYFASVSLCAGFMYGLSSDIHKAGPS